MKVFYKITCTLVFLLCVAHWMSGQTLNLDELETEIKKLTMQRKHQERYPLLEQALELAKKENNKEVAEKSLLRMMQSNAYLNDIKEIERLFNNRNSILGFAPSILGLSEFYTVFSRAKIESGEFEKGLLLLHRADSLAGSVGSDALYTKTIIAGTYARLRRIGDSNKVYFEIYRLSKEAGNKIYSMMALKAIVLNNPKKLHEEPFYFYLNEYISARKDMGSAGHDLFEIINQDPFPDKALDLLYEKYKTHESIDTRWVFIASYIEDLQKKGNLKKAVEIGEEELGRLGKNDLPEKKVLLRKRLAEMFFELGNPKNAYEHLNEAWGMEEALRAKNSAANIDSLIVKFETAEKEKQIAQQTLEINNKTNQRNMLIATSLILFLLGGSVFYILNQRNRNNQLIAEKNAEIQRQQILELEKTNRLNSLDAMITGQEEERKRIAKDLHDGLGGLLATVKLQFASVQREVEKLAESNVYQKANHLLDDACVEVRKIAHNMMPDALMKLGLYDAVKDMSENIEENNGINIQVNNIGFESRLEETKEVMLFRIIQELFNNIIKHAEAKNIIIQFSKYDNELTLTIEDDGNGFNLENAKKEGGLGLKSIQSRVDYLEGNLEINTEKGVGTTTNISMKV